MSLAESGIDLGNTAGLYSQIAGVLAALAFSALLSYLRRPEPGEESISNHRDTTVVLFTTIGALILCAITYGQVAGGPVDQGAAYSGFFLIGPAFCLAILGMFYAILLAARPYQHLESMSYAARIVVGVIGPAVSMFLVAGAANDVEIRRCTGSNPAPADSCFAVGVPFVIGLILAAALGGGSLVLLLRTKKAVPKPLSRGPSMVGWLILGFAITTPLSAVFVASQPYDYLLPAWALIIGQMIIFAVLGAFVRTVLRAGGAPASQSVSA
jgi:hypothetical protein